jgi:hypothetical protein
MEEARRDAQVQQGIRAARNLAEAGSLRMEAYLRDEGSQQDAGER